ncbi:MAG TPA: circadian clock KaiB family protein [Burkholderiaceae bacterium]
MSKVRAIATTQAQFVSFRLYMAAGAQTSELALLNLSRICRDYYSGHYAIEKIDILSEPLRTLSDGVLLTPTLVRVAPPPERTIVGDLSDTELLLQALGLQPLASTPASRRGN